MNIRSFARTAFNIAAKAAKHTVNSPAVNRVAGNVVGAAAFGSVLFAVPTIIAFAPVGVMFAVAGMGLMLAADKLTSRANTLQAARQPQIAPRV